MMMRNRRSNWSKEKARHYDDPEYKRNRAKVLQRDLGCCVRCWHLYQRIVLTNVCDHYRNVAATEQPDHSLQNLWLLCDACHSIKTAREANGKAGPSRPFGFYDRTDEGWSVKVDWQAVIHERNKEYLGINK